MLSQGSHSLQFHLKLETTGGGEEGALSQSGPSGVYLAPWGRVGNRRW